MTNLDSGLLFGPPCIYTLCSAIILHGMTSELLTASFSIQWHTQIIHALQLHRLSFVCNERNAFNYLCQHNCRSGRREMVNCDLYIRL